MFIKAQRATGLDNDKTKSLVVESEKRNDEKKQEDKKEVKWRNGKRNEREKMGRKGRKQIRHVVGC